jgi:hypothetical protein
MRTDRTPVAPGKFLAIAAHLGAEVLEQKGCWKVTSGGAKDRAIYICKGNMVTRVDISGFIHPLGITHTSPPTNRVPTMMDFSKDEVSILKDFAQIIKEGLIAREGNTIATVRGTRGGTPLVQPTEEEIASAVLIACGE